VPDAGADSPAVPLDAPGAYVVTTTSATGAGSLTDGVARANAECPPVATILFDIPPSDPGVVGGVAHLAPTATHDLTCARLTLERTSQTLRHGDTNAFVFTVPAVGFPARASESIPGPEVALDDTGLWISGADIVVRGLGASSVLVRAPGALVEDVVLGVEPDALAPEAGRTGDTAAYVDSASSTFRRVVFGGSERASFATNMVLFNQGTHRVESALVQGWGGDASAFDAMHVRGGATVQGIGIRVDADGYEMGFEVSAAASVELTASTVEGGTVHALNFQGGTRATISSSVITGAAGAALHVHGGASARLTGTVFGDSGGVAIQNDLDVITASATDCGYDAGAGSEGLDPPTFVRVADTIEVRGCPAATATVGVARPLRGDGSAGELVGPVFTVVLDASGRGVLPGLLPAGPLTAYLTDLARGTSALATNFTP
jgi:hypothetical protein